MNRGLRAPQPSYFDTAYRDYRRQNPVRKLDHYLDVVAGHVQESAPKLLDIGCGLGAFLQRAHSRFPTWWLFGTDISDEATRVSQAGAKVGEFIISAAQEQPFPDDFFDVITAWDVVEHVQDLVAVRSSVASLLRRGGVFAFVVPVYDGLTGPLIQSLDRDPTHIHKRERRFWLDWASVRFDILEWHGIFRYLMFSRWYMHHPTRALRQHSPAILVIARLR